MHESSLNYLENFITELTGNSSGRVLHPIEPCPIIADYNLEPGKVNQIDDQISYYIPINPCGGGGGGGGNPNPNPTPPAPVVDPFEAYINNLSPCGGFSGWANWLFGDSRICHSNFTNKSRVRTKFWNQNYYLWRSVGVKVKHQFKTLVWYDAKIDELRLGIRSAYHLYVPSFDTSGYIPPSNTQIKTMIYNQKRYNFSNYTPTLYQFDNDAAALPAGIDINVIIELPLSTSNQATTENYINTNIRPDVKEKLDRFFTANNINPNNLKGIILSVIREDRIGYKRVNSFFKENDSKKLEQSLAFDEPNFSFALKNGKPDWKKIKLKVKNTYKNASVEAYGVGRRGNDVRGSLLVASGLNPVFE